MLFVWEKLIKVNASRRVLNIRQNGGVFHSALDTVASSFALDWAFESAVIIKNNRLLFFLTKVSFSHHKFHGCPLVHVESVSILIHQSTRQ